MKIKTQIHSNILFGVLLVISGTLINANSLKAGESSSVDKGKAIFEGRTCADCHKDGGNLLKPSKPLKGTAFDKKYKDDAKLIQAIRKGVPGSSMRGFGVAEINDSEIKDLVAYIRSFSTSTTSKSK